MHPWHEVELYNENPKIVPAIIEVPKGSQIKYELDKKSGLVKVDRILYSSVHYPANYGFIPRTYSEDNDPLDVFVLCSQPIEKMSLVRCYPIGVISMIDRDADDDKIIAIPFGDPQYNGYKDLKELPIHIFEELQHFLRVYKELEDKKVEIRELGDHDKAVEVINEALALYKKTFSK